MTKPRELVGIQYLRGLAALLVVLDHASGMTSLPKYFNQPIANGLFTNGFVGVDLFFVISGFIIAYISLHETSLAPRIRVRPYAVRRFARIVPFLWLCVLGYAALRWLGRGTFAAGPYVRALFLVPVGDIKPNVVWTLRHEVLFYLVFASVLILPRMRFIVAAVWMMTPLLFLTGICAWPPEGTLSAFLFSPLNLLFAAGMLAALLHLHWPRVQGPKSSLPLLVLLVAGMGLTVALIHYDRKNWIHIVGMGLFCAMLIWLGLNHGSERLTWIEKQAKVLGDASYAIYLTHEAWVSAVLGLWIKLNRHQNVALVFPAVAALALVLGVLVHRWVERPLVEWTNRSFRPLLARP